MNEMKKQISNRLLIIHPRVYDEEAPQLDPSTMKPPEYPYLVYKLTSSNMVFQREDFILEVDVWDNRTSTERLENLTDSANSVLDRYRYFSNGFHFRLYKMNRSALPDPDEKIRRRQLRYDCKAYL